MSGSTGELCLLILLSVFNIGSFIYSITNIPSLFIANWLFVTWSLAICLKAIGHTSIVYRSDKEF